MNPTIEERLKAPYMRSSLLYALELAVGHRYGSIKELREEYPNLPRPLPLEKLAECIRILADDPMAGDRLWGKRSVGAPRRSGDKEAIAIAVAMHLQGATLRAIGAKVGRSPSWVKNNV
jgi:hypothetical protein